MCVCVFMPVMCVPVSINARAFFCTTSGLAGRSGNIPEAP